MSKFQLTLVSDTAAGLIALAAEYAGMGGNDDDDNGPVNTAAPAVDSQGIPWDERIHLKSRKTNADGTWGRKRGVEPAQYEAIVNELKARIGGNGGTVGMPQVGLAVGGYPGAGVMPQTGIMPQTGMMQQPQPGMMPGVGMQPQPGMMQQQPQQTQQPGLDFNGLISKIGPMMQAGTLPQQTLNEILNAVGVPSFNDLPMRPDAIPQIVNQLAMRGLWSA